MGKKYYFVDNETIESTATFASSVVFPNPKSIKGSVFYSNPLNYIEPNSRTAKYTNPSSFMPLKFTIASHRNMSQLGSCHSFSYSIKNDTNLFGDELRYLTGKFIGQTKCIIITYATDNGLAFPAKLARFVRS